MQFIDISHDTQTTYRLKRDEKKVFFLRNRSGALTFELTEPGATAHIFALFDTDAPPETTLSLRQHHLAPQTTSNSLVKSIVTEHTAPSCRGEIHIAQNAQKSIASQAIHALLLASRSPMLTEPTLEILANDVQCSHAATAGPPNKAALFYAMSRGLDQKTAAQLLTTGFLSDIQEKISSHGVPATTLAALIPCSP